MSDIEKAGLKNLVFSWAGSREDGPGHPKYYRIQGPTIIIEYDNTQNNANHVHTVVRDLKNDFGGDYRVYMVRIVLGIIVFNNNSGALYAIIFGVPWSILSTARPGE